MSTDTVIRNQEAVIEPKPQTLPMSELLDRVRRDSQVEADKYLEESTVPHGGE